MRSRIFLILISCFVFLGVVFCSGCKKQENDKSADFVVGFDVDVPPMGFLNDKGDPTGFDIELAKETFKVMGKTVRFQPIDWDAKELELSSGKIDLIWNGMSYTPEREKSMLLSSPYMKNRQIVVVRKDSKFQALGDLNQKLMCAQKGSTGMQALKDSEVGKNAKSITELDSMVDCLNDVKLWKSDATVVDEVVFRHYLAQESMKDDFRALGEEISTEDYVIAFKKGNVELKNQVEAALKIVVEKGIAGELSEKWFGVNVLNFSV